MAARRININGNSLTSSEDLTLHTHTHTYTPARYTPARYTPGRQSHRIKEAAGHASRKDDQYESSSNSSSSSSSSRIRIRSRSGTDIFAIWIYLSIFNSNHLMSFSRRLHGNFCFIPNRRRQFLPPQICHRCHRFVMRRAAGARWAPSLFLYSQRQSSRRVLIQWEGGGGGGRWEAFSHPSTFCFQFCSWLRQIRCHSDSIPIN